MATWIIIGRPLKSKPNQRLCNQRPRKCCCLCKPAALQYHDCRGCVFETLLTKPSKVEGTDQQAYAAIRSQWPCDPAVCRLLFGPKIVTTLLHMGSDRLQHHVSLFNDQVEHPWCTMHACGQTSQWSTITQCVAHSTL